MSVWGRLAWNPPSAAVVGPCRIPVGAPHSGVRGGAGVLVVRCDATRDGGDENAVAVDVQLHLRPVLAAEFAVCVRVDRALLFIEFVGDDAAARSGGGGGGGRRFRGPRPGPNPPAGERPGGPCFPAPWCCFLFFLKPPAS